VFAKVADDEEVGSLENGRELLQAIADLGGLDPFATLAHLVSVSSPIRHLDDQSVLLRHLLDFLRDHRSEDNDRRLKEMLWDARAATVNAKGMDARERSERLRAIDRTGNRLFIVQRGD
jgi:hypothetical protein